MYLLLYGVTNLKSYNLVAAVLKRHSQMAVTLNKLYPAIGSKMESPSFVVVTSKELDIPAFSKAIEDSSKILLSRLNNSVLLSGTSYKYHRWFSDSKIPKVPGGTYLLLQDDPWLVEISDSLTRLGTYTITI